MLKFLGEKRKRQLLRGLSSDPLSEGHPVYRDNFLCLKEVPRKLKTPGSPRKDHPKFIYQTKVPNTSSAEWPGLEIDWTGRS